MFWYEKWWNLDQNFLLWICLHLFRYDNFINLDILHLSPWSWNCICMSLLLVSQCLCFLIFASSLHLKALIFLHLLKVSIAINCSFLHSLDVLSTLAIWSSFLLHSDFLIVLDTCLREWSLWCGFTFLMMALEFQQTFIEQWNCKSCFKWMIDALLYESWTCIVGEYPSCLRILKFPMDTWISQFGWCDFGYKILFASHIWTLWKLHHVITCFWREIDLLQPS